MSTMSVVNQSCSAMPQSPAVSDPGDARGDLGSTADFSQMMSMTNAELVQFGKDHDLSDIKDFFSVNYTPVDRSASAETSMLAALMADPTKHDVIKDFTSNAQWDTAIGDAGGSTSWMNIVNELKAAAGRSGTAS